MSEVKPTLLQIDLQNLFYEARNRGQRLDLDKIWNYFHGREAELVTDAIVYMVRGDDFDSSKFEAKLRNIGYTIKVKDAIRVSRGDDKFFYRQTDHDVAITVDCMDRLGNFEKWVFMSSDGDFADLAKALRQKGKQVEVWCFGGTKAVDQFTPYVDQLYKIDDTFFYRPPDLSVFGMDGFPNEWTDGLGNRRFGPRQERRPREGGSPADGRGGGRS